MLWYIESSMIFENKFPIGIYPKTAVRAKETDIPTIPIEKVVEHFLGYHTDAGGLCIMLPYPCMESLLWFGLVRKWFFRSTPTIIDPQGMKVMCRDGLKWPSPGCPTWL